MRDGRSWRRFGPLRRFRGPVDAVLLQLGVDGLGQAGLGEADDFRATNTEELFQVRFHVMLHDWVMRELLQNLLPAVFGNVGCDEDKVQPAFAVRQGFPSDEQDARSQNEREQALDRFGWFGAAH